MKLSKIAIMAASAALSLTLAGCKKDMSDFSQKTQQVTQYCEEIVKNEIKDVINSDKFDTKSDLSQLNRNDFNHAALRLNLPIFWMYEENPADVVRPEVLTTLNFYPTSETFQWKDEKGEFTADFYRAYDQMVEVMKSPEFGAVLHKEKLIRLKKYQEMILSMEDRAWWDSEEEQKKDNAWFGASDYYKQLIAKVKQDHPELAEVIDDEKHLKFVPSPLHYHIIEFLRDQIADPEIIGKTLEKDRLGRVAEELDQAAVTLVSSDFSKSDDKEKAFVRAMIKVGELIDNLYAKQVGIDKILALIPEHDLISRSMVRRNWGVNAESPKMKNDRDCRAIDLDEDKITIGIYPEDLQSDHDFCAKLDARPDADTLLDHFSVVVKNGDDLKPVPYNEFFKEEMTAISEALKVAAATLEGNEKEAALKKYIDAAAESFLSNDWNPADEAWAAMNSTNSAWYVRVAPDETYWEPCSRHAGFHLTFARINPDALSWQEKLNPLQQDMEKEMAKIAGKPYKERKVSFHLPDFIDIVTNSGDDRDAFGATIGQSLPNWGPVANEGRGRTVAMSNLYTDPDSLRDRQTLASSMFTEKDMYLLKDGKGPGLLSTILHEAAHNLGPAHEYTVKGKKDNDIYGGALASMAEEFKAQTAALWYLPYLVQKGAISQDLANKSYADSVYWAFGHISKGMTNSEGRIQPYSQLAAIQVGMMLEDGALKFDPEAMAANGTDKGAFVLDLEKMPASVERIMKAIAQSKAKGDKDALVQLQKKHVEGTAIPFDIIRERMLRLPKTSFVYSVKY